MADNRMYLHCKACGEDFFLGKHYSDGWFCLNYRPEEGSFLERLNAFYDKHCYCNGYPLECFEIQYEDAPTIIEAEAEE